MGPYMEPFIGDDPDEEVAARIPRVRGVLLDEDYDTREEDDE